MNDCDDCGVSLAFPRDCSYCGRTYCYDHRLPEAHDCNALLLLSGEGRLVGAFPGESQ